jgi:hypothetical protein
MLAESLLSAACARAEIPPLEGRYTACALVMSPRKPVVLTLARLFAVIACFCISARMADSEV